MEEFVTIETLGTFAVMSGVVYAITEFVKRLPFAKNVDEQVLTTITGIIMMIILSVAIGKTTVADFLLAAVNGVIVGFTSNGVFDAVQTLSAGGKK